MNFKHLGQPIFILCFLWFAGNSCQKSIPVSESPYSIHNIQGFDIVLGFNIVGPTFKPRGELAELPPASVTFVSGALEIARDTISIIDTPRKILVDLLKIGGGIVGAGTTK